MINIIKNVIKNVTRAKTFFLFALILPIVLTLGFTKLNSNVSSYNIGIINNDKGSFGGVIEDRLKEIEGIEINEIKEEDIEKNIVFHLSEIVITIPEGFTENLISGEDGGISYRSVSKGDMEPSIIAILNNEVASLSKLCNNISIKDQIDSIIETYKGAKVNYEVIKTDNNKVGIEVSLGIIFYVMFMLGAVTCSFLITDERQGTKDRVLMGKISEKTYYAGMGLVFWVIAAIPAVIYFIMCIAMKLEFGFDNKVVFFLILLEEALFTVMFYVMLSTIIKKKTVFTAIGSAITVPMFMLSGAFWPFEMMSEGIQKIGSVLPPRWIYIAIDKLRQGGSVVDILPTIVGLLVVSVFLFLLGSFFTKNKIVLVKDED